MKDKIHARILELRTELEKHDPEPAQTEIDELRGRLDDLVNNHNTEMEKVTTLNNELVYWLDVLDKVEEIYEVDSAINNLVPVEETDEDLQEDLEEEAELNKEELE